jgi:hypothetical protein
MKSGPPSTAFLQMFFQAFALTRREPDTRGAIPLVTLAVEGKVGDVEMKTLNLS